MPPPMQSSKLKNICGLISKTSAYNERTFYMTLYIMYVNGGYFQGGGQPASNKGRMPLPTPPLPKESLTYRVDVYASRKPRRTLSEKHLIANIISCTLYTCLLATGCFSAIAFARAGLFPPGKPRKILKVKISRTGFKELHVRGF